MVSVRVSHAMLSRPLPSCSVNNDYVTATIACSAAHVCHRVLRCSGAALCGVPVWDSWKPWLLPHWGYSWAALWWRYVWGQCHGYVIATLWLCCGCCYGCFSQPGESWCNGCHASQERINVSAVPWVSFQPLWLAPCLPWVQRTVWPVWTVRQLASRTGPAVHSENTKYPYKFSTYVECPTCVRH